MFAALCFNYDSADGKRWGMVGVDKDTLTAMAYLQNTIGLTEAEVHRLVVAINAQHGTLGADKFAEYGIIVDTATLQDSWRGRWPSDDMGKDFAHEMIFWSIATGSGVIRTGINVAMFEQLNIMSNFKGDIISTRMDMDDTLSDIDSMNIYYRLAGNNKDLMTVIMEYNQDILDGKTNRAVEFLENYGGGDLEKGRKNVEKDINSWSLGVEYLKGTIKLRYTIDEIVLMVGPSPIGNNDVWYESLERARAAEKEEEKRLAALEKEIPKKKQEFLDYLDNEASKG